MWCLHICIRFHPHTLFLPSYQYACSFCRHPDTHTHTNTFSYISLFLYVYEWRDIVCFAASLIQLFYFYSSITTASTEVLAFNPAFTSCLCQFNFVYSFEWPRHDIWLVLNQTKLLSRHTEPPAANQPTRSEPTDHPSSSFDSSGCWVSLLISKCMVKLA